MKNTASNTAPVSEAGVSQVSTSGDTVSVTLGDTVSLTITSSSVSASSDADGANHEWRFDSLPSASVLEDSDIVQGGGLGFWAIIFASWVIAKATQVPRIAATLALTPIAAKWWRGRGSDSETTKDAS